MSIIQETPNSYVVALLASDVSAGYTDWLTIQGSATKLIKIKRLQLSGIATSAIAFTWQIIRRSSANTGGGVSAQTPVAINPSAGAATATVNLVTANQTLGTTVGKIWATYMNFGTSAAPTAPFVKEWDNLYINGTSDFLCINLNTQAPAGADACVVIEFDELQVT